LEWEEAMMMETEGMGGGLAEPEFGGFFEEEPAEGGEDEEEVEEVEGVGFGGDE
jgi:hypothetical protein